MFFSACAQTKSTKTYDTTNNESYKTQNILVIAIAADYDSRARFERDLAKALKSSGTAAAAYYSVGGGNTPIDRDSIAKLVASNGFDTEPPRVYRRLHFLRGWSNEQVNEIFAGSSRAGCTVGV